MSEKTISIALSQFGIVEWAGESDNPEVLKYFSETGNSWVKDDETSWCAAFVNWVCMKAELPYSKKLTARSWLKIGEGTKDPEVGDIVVLWRESKSSWKGHVGFFVRQTKNYIYILGGNQGNRVKISKYPKARLLSYRRL